jgi:PKD repeat protein
MNSKSRRFFILFFLVFIINLACENLNYAQMNWVIRNSYPSPRGYFSIVYDAARSETVLFGGWNAVEFNDTWVWNGSQWKMRTPSAAPRPRYFQGMVYDGARSEIVLFGGVYGSNNVTLNDTWVWNGATWTQKNPPTSPGARFGHIMAFDASRGEVVLFGGWNSGSALGDTWVWNGTSWTQKLPYSAPTPRWTASAVYDAARGEVVLFGGTNTSGRLSDTWVWNGATWTQKNPLANPGGRDEFAMAYDSTWNEVVVFGGFNGSSAVSDTWAWNGAIWTQTLPGSSPGQRYGLGMAYDIARKEAVLFGGTTNGVTFMGDTWTWKDTSIVCSLTCSATAPAAEKQGTAVSFQGNAQLSQGCSQPITYQWNFGDGGTSTEKNPTHTYTVEGTYPWSMTVSADEVAPCTSFDAIKITTQAPPCVVTTSAKVPANGAVGKTVSFTGTAKTSPNCPSPKILFKWDFGDGATPATTKDSTHIYKAAGTFKWSFTATASGAATIKNGKIVIKS